MRINIKPIHRTRADGYQAIVGTDFDVSLINTATEKTEKMLKKGGYYVEH
ncbi:MAG: hypothetical protein ACYS6K_24315 [Planctomycetota bacterium]